MHHDIKKFSKVAAQKANTTQTGQTLLEVIIAIGVITVGIIGTIALVITSTKAGNVSQNELIATNLAREGIEVARSIRDNNWLAIEANTPGVTWDQDLFDPAAPGGGLAGFTAIPLFDADNNQWSLDFDANDFITTCTDHTCTQVFRTQDQLHQYADALPPGTSEVPFARLVTLRPICRDENNAEALLEDSSKVCADLANQNGLGAQVKKVGVEIESQVRYRVEQEEATYTLVDRVYNWKPGVVDE
ncbi:MAG: hypothetical protein A3B74_02740 [Candidatus Kerfeldbacteria bacterium RIFCSPHIGHO2_02_FULL_42_14]|uniref:Type IV pilus modification protein PilV n=1 Tax=Candidatus Kerfeldbacteria bacterium RIFCSPHIGHO2_02_FULL_42_14 TaxID=1798540 RepID=A0A1G2ASM2_9BACT|nr:MAG: hypothetical protein A3B74_02740 [Candidatus Kerfeldbacteria bacterium RIFCSPHIGHO2_02_FULL_42_14]OGY80457.1 MAG: hypothetical protein A3E60_05360 [Candidatus Kerfeldbacteria bacterium RIFCSPHIGHO2_12_FULL_42_13]OGY83887.1 MAG: hypothetical protein A3I91_04885 [Candidatus Kerfeldbacteria bacterium RIFCSPLOWO2_02_FULL_42_19]OGY86574.1 MAG: hypothetical protein A3G01_04945 [Candidatus Kerfeldbacteria bacterium RIFCSPLOWO2_12_FULL_43_9]